MIKRLLFLTLVAGVSFQLVARADREVTKIKIIGASNKHSSDAVRIGFSFPDGVTSQNKGFFLAPAKTVELDLDVVAPGVITVSYMDNTKKRMQEKSSKQLPATLRTEYFDKNGIVRGMIIYHDQNDFEFQPIMPS
jgi:hypothetical protein